LYEGEQEGPYQVAVNLVEKSIRNQFALYFPSPETLKKKRNTEKAEENPYKAVIEWFNAGNSLNLFLETKDDDKIQMLYKVSGLHALVTKYFNAGTEKETALLMELVLHGLSAYSLISKKILNGKIEFKDLMGSMLNIGSEHFDEEDFDEEDYN
jgi:magnesium chelatase subunit I